VALLQALKQYLSFWNKKERFLLLEILPQISRISLIKADFENKELFVSRVVNFRRPALKKILKQFGDLSKYKILISLDSRLATTIYSSVVLVRDRPRDAIDEPDLDNLLSQAVWKFFDRHRAAAAAKMNINDFDVLLTDIRIGQIKLDGHKVINPLGFKARSLEVGICQTVIPRSFINELKEALPLDRILLIGEAGAIWTRFINRIAEEKNLTLVNVFSGETHLFYSDGARLAYHDELKWGRGNLISAIAETLAVAPAVAENIMALFNRKEISPGLFKKIENLFMEELGFLIRGVENALSRKNQRQVYINTFSSLPPTVFSSAFKNKFSFSVKLSPADQNFITENYQFKLKYKKLPADYNLFAAAALILESNLASNDKITQLAKRRVRWLSPI
jgi:hypothetical protein